jgi:histidine ammonia-lyase
LGAVELGGERITVGDLVRVARAKASVTLAGNSLKKCIRTRELIEDWLDKGRPVYGVTTGFGALCTEFIPKEKAVELQVNLLKSHACGVGEPFPEEVVRAVMALRVQDLAQGYSGVRPETILMLVELLNRRVYPVVPEKGSVGASGDLAPMAHLALVLTGRGEVFHQGRRVSGREGLQSAGLTPLELQAGEGLGLINGTQVMNGLLVLAVHDAHHLSKATDIACALSLEVLLGSKAEFDPRIHSLRPHPGQVAAAANMERLTAESEIVSSHKDCATIQDAYTLRCSPQVHGASKDSLVHVQRIVDIEINSTTTNPLIMPDSGEILLGGNFHGQPLAQGADLLSMAMAELGNISERRIERLVNPQLSGLPAFLVEDTGLNSGFMIAQYTAAALVSENKTLAHPASVDSIPTSANKEDHVSMGTFAARKARTIIHNVEYVLAVELLCGVQALDLLTRGRAGPGTQTAYAAIREAVPFLDHDRILATDIEKVAELIRSGELVRRVEAVVGELE